jgi:glycosyltransferase involved in cell wall biosynthesis
MTEPLVSCLMVTKNRRHLARRAVECFTLQTWQNKELVIIDDGDDDYAPMLEPYRSTVAIRYFRVTPKPGSRLGDLRNLSLDCAEGEFVAQWDDDEWYHPERIEQQMRAISGGLDVAVLRNALVHLDREGFVDHLFRTAMTTGNTPGSILQRRSDVRYRSMSRAEDTEYLARLGETTRVGVLDEPHSHLFIRCFHGRNTWDLNHFEGALRTTRRDKLDFYLAKYIRRDLRRHRAFQLTELERDAAEKFLRHSRDLGILQG